MNNIELIKKEVRTLLHNFVVSSNDNRNLSTLLSYSELEEILNLFISKIPRNFINEVTISYLNLFLPLKEESRDNKLLSKYFKNSFINYLKDETKENLAKHIVLTYVEYLDKFGTDSLDNLLLQANNYYLSHIINDFETIKEEVENNPIKGRTLSINTAEDAESYLIRVDEDNNLIPTKEVIYKYKQFINK